MNTKNKLIFGQASLLLILIITFGLIIINEKAGEIFTPKVKEKMDNYLEDNYKNTINEINKNKVTYKNRKFKMKISSKKNKNLYFYLNYNKGQIKDTYNSDYLEGQSLYNNLKKSMERDILKRTNTKYEVDFTNKLNNYNSKVQERIINENNLLNLKFYYLSNEFEVQKWDYLAITNEIINKLNILKSKNINPKYLNFTIINANDITESITISNLTLDFINDTHNQEIIYTILTKGSLTNTNITYKYN